MNQKNNTEFEEKNFNNSKLNKVFFIVCGAFILNILYMMSIEFTIPFSNANWISIIGFFVLGSSLAYLTYLKNKDLYTKHKKLIHVCFIILLMLIPMLFAGYIRSYSYTLPITDTLAKQNMKANIQQQIYQQVISEYPNLNEQIIIKEVNERYAEFYNDNKEEILRQEKELSIYYKSQYQEDNGQTYLLEIDPYYHHTLAYNILKNGHKGDGMTDEGNSILYKRLAPTGSDSSTSDFHTWMEVNAFKLNGLDETSSNGERTKAIYFLPVLFSMLCIIPLFLILRLYSSNLFAFLSSLSLATMSTFLYRTIAGFVDTDAYNVFFPLLILSIVIYSLFTSNTKVGNTLSFMLSILAAGIQVIYLWAWGNAWFSFFFIAVALLSYVIYEIVSKLFAKDFKLKDILKPSLVFIGFTFFANLFSYVISEQGLIVQSIRTILNSSEGLSFARFGNIWPNVFSSVGELNPASFETILMSVGGRIIFFVAMIGLLFLALDFKNIKEKINIYKLSLLGLSTLWFSLFIIKFGTTNLFYKINSYLLSLTNNSPLTFLILLFLPVFIAVGLSIYNKQHDGSKMFLTILLLIWMMGTLFMSFQGVRFVLLLIPAFSIAFGLGMFYLAKLMNEKILHWIDLKENIFSKHIGTFIMLFLFIVTFIPIARASDQMAREMLPGFDDQWVVLMDKINNNSYPDAIITSWWDFGHFFINMADRGATFDGGAQTTPQSHWVGKLLLENNELVAKDILRMLVCGGNEAFDVMQEITNDSTGGVLVNKIIYQTLGKDDETKKEILMNNKYFNLTDSESNQVLKKLACQEEPENFLIVSEDMVSKTPVWAHWGSWDFSKKYTLDYYNKLTVKEIANNIDEPETKINQWVTELKELDMRASVQNIKRSDLVNQWLAPYPGYVSFERVGTWLPCSHDNKTNTLNCMDIIKVDLNNEYNETFEETVETASFVQQQGATINRLIIADIELSQNSSSTIKKIIQNKDGEFDVVLKIVSAPDVDKKEYSVMLVSYPLGYSIYTKLFYLGLTETNSFDLFDVRSVSNGWSVKTWKTNWN